MADPETSPAPVDSRLVALLRIAGDLRGAPDAAFRARLKATLLAAAERWPAAPGYGKPLATLADIEARLAELAHGPTLAAYDIETALHDLPELTMRFLATLNQCTVGVSRFSAHSHWERHPAGDEMLHILEGEVDITTLTDDGPVHSTAGAGSIFICPQGLWHQLRPRSPVSLLFATPGGGTEHSAAPAARRRARPRSGSRPRAFAAYDVNAALDDLPELAITPRTTGAEAAAAVRSLAWLEQSRLGVMRFSGLTPWERHPDGDELLHVLAGEIEVTVLADDGPVHVTVPTGSVFVCPRGLWHRQQPQPAVAELFATPRETEVSWAEDPR